MATKRRMTYGVVRVESDGSIVGWAGVNGWTAQFKNACLYSSRKEADSIRSQVDGTASMHRDDLQRMMNGGDPAPVFTLPTDIEEPKGKKIGFDYVRYYPVKLGNGQEVEFPSVTAIMDATLAKPALIKWAGDVGKEAGLEAMIALWDLKANLSELKKEKFVELAERLIGEGAAHVRKMRKAGNIGTEVHKRVEWDLKKMIGIKVGKQPGLTTDAAELAYMAFKEWEKEVELEPLGSEERIASVEHEYAGTLDIRARLQLPEWDDRHEAIVDVKSGGVYTEARIQSAAYRVAEAEMNKRERPLPGVVIQVPKTLEDLEKMELDVGRPFRAIEMPMVQKHFPGFLGLRRAFDMMLVEKAEGFKEWVRLKELGA